MGDINSVPNHTIDPATGFVVSLAYEDAFTPEKKLRYLEMFEASGGLVCRTAYELGMNDDTVRKHMRIDPKFAQLITAAKQRCNENVEGVLYKRALDPRGAFDRAVWLRNNYRDKYGEQQSNTGNQITINIDGNLLKKFEEKQKVVDAQIVTSTQQSEIKSVDNQHV
jgi:hypothetical protein